MMRARCDMLATVVAPGIMRCPTTIHRFHYHGIVSGGPVVAILTGRAPCPHRHTSEDAAESCSKAAGERLPVRLAAVAARRSASVTCADCAIPVRLAHGTPRPAIIRCYQCAQRAYYDGRTS